MGLDMYAFVSNGKDESGEWIDPIEIAYWRKHPNTHGWMEQRWRDRTGSQEVFNCISFELTKEDIDDFEIAVDKGILPHTEGFFFGKSTPEDTEVDRKFIERARGCLEQGKHVFYYSWW